MDYLDAEQYFAGCTGYSLSECALSIDGGKLSREASLAKSDFFTKPMSSSAIESLLGQIEDRSKTPALSSQAGGVLFDAWGGAIADVSSTATALPLRSATYLAQEFVTFGTLSQAGVHANQTWLDSLWHGLRPSVSGYAYVNYIDPQLSDWQNAYYGSNLGPAGAGEADLRSRRRVPLRAEHPDLDVSRADVPIRARAGPMQRCDSSAASTAPTSPWRRWSSAWGSSSRPS